MRVMAWVFIQTEPGVYTVGFHDPNRGWNPTEDYSSKEEAARECHYLNGGCDEEMLAALNAVFKARAPQLNFDFENAPDMQMLAAAIKKAEGGK